MNTMMFVFIIVFSVFVVPGFYLLFNILHSQSVKAQIVNYEGKRFTGNGQLYAAFYPVYGYIYNGMERKYRSGIDLLIPFTKKPARKLYIRKDGKVFELRAALTLLGIGALILVLGMLGMFG